MILLRKRAEGLAMTVVLLLAGARSVHAQVGGPLVFQQISYGSRDTGNVPSSEYGHVEFTVNLPATGLMYVQVAARIDAGPVACSAGLPLPLAPRLCGLPLCAQWAALCPQGGISLSQGLSCTLIGP